MASCLVIHSMKGMRDIVSGYSLLTVFGSGLTMRVRTSLQAGSTAFIVRWMYVPLMPRQNRLVLKWRSSSLSVDVALGCVRLHAASPYALCIVALRRSIGYVTTEYITATGYFFHSTGPSITPSSS